MPVTYSIDGSLVRLDLEGEYEPEDVTTRFLEALADAKFPPVAAMLIDASHSTVLASRDPMQIRYVAQFAGPHADRIGRRCAVVVSADIQFSLTKLGAVFSEGVGIEARVFRSEVAAMEWLGVTPPGES